MKLSSDVKVGEWTIPAGFQTDGCTMPDFLKGIMNANKYYLCCVRHDFMRRYHIVPPGDADRMLRQCVAKHDKVRAWCYWLAVKLMRKQFSYTLPLPEQWQAYRFPAKEA